MPGMLGALIAQFKFFRRKSRHKNILDSLRPRRHMSHFLVVEESLLPSHRAVAH
jgi:hypothetical protein